MNFLYCILATPITYVEVALVLFISVFISMLARECLRPRQEVTHLSCLPMEPDAGTADKERSHE